jgi:hypothetical protein
MKKKDFILIGTIVVIAILMWIILQIFWPGGGDVLRISIDSEVYGTYDMKENQTIRIQETNVCQIQDGEVVMLEGDCPDQLCVEHKEIGREEGGTIVCLPNRVVLEIMEP